MRVSIRSTAPLGDGANKTGNAVAVYSFKDGVPSPERLIALPLQKLAPGKTQNNVGSGAPAGSAIPAPAGLAVVSNKGSEDQLLIANEFSDNAVLLDAATGRVVHSFDLSESTTIPAAFPIAATVTRDGRRGFIALWNSSEVVELDLAQRHDRSASQVASARTCHLGEFASFCICIQSRPENPLCCSLES